MYKVSLTILMSLIACLATFIAPRLGIVPPPKEKAPNTTPPLKDEVATLPLLPTRINGTEPVHHGHLKLITSVNQTAIPAEQWSERFLTVSVEAPEIAGKIASQPVNLGIVMDVSGSMSARGKLEYAKLATTWIANHLEDRDRFNLVTFSDDAHVLVRNEPVQSGSALTGTISAIQEGGGTNLYAGLEVGHQEVLRGDTSQNLDRLIVLSDGKANIGLSDPESLEGVTQRIAASGVTVSTVGLGRDFNEELLQSISDFGSGTYAFVDNPSELETAFQDELNRSKSVIAQNTKINIQLSEEVEFVRVLGWNAEHSGSELNVALGDIYSGDKKQIIIQVRVKGDSDGVIPLAKSELVYLDRIDDKQATAIQHTQIEVSSDTTHVANSINKENSELTTHALANWHLKKANDAYRSGSTRQVEKHRMKGLETLRRAAKVLKSHKLDSQIGDFEQRTRGYEETPADSHEGKYLLKDNAQNAVSNMRNK